MAQRAAGVTPQVLARPKPRPAWTPPHPPPPAPPSSGGNPAPVPPENWPPPPAQWEPAGPGRWAPPPPPGPATSQPSPAPSSSRNWTGTAALRSRISNTLPWQQRTSTQEPPPTYFWQSLACLFLFLPTAAVAVGYSFLVSRREQAGDRTGAAKASRLARTWCLASLASFTVLILAAAAGMPV
ncbi:MAG TPA: CD225/dispanin family protein [Acidimicrobiales bacterium]|nr:CD225/dispanin family protein [Acidimicrobiales bacterium]